jgi:hypothetical protein
VSDEDARFPGPVERVLNGAIDMHVHGYPDVGLHWKMRTDDLTLIRGARAAGMRGIVLKSHFWPTMDRAMSLNERFDAPDFTVWSSITLNPLIGGLQPTTVEAAAEHGAKVVFFPTWGSLNDHRHGGVVRQQVIDRLLPSFSRYLDDAAISVTERGMLHPAVRDILDVAKARDLVVSTAHLSTGESVKVAEAAADIGFERLVFAHPFSPSVAASPAVIDDIAATGAKVEVTAVLTMLPKPPVQLTDVYKMIRRLGPRSILLTSDVFFAWLPPHAEMLSMFVGQLRSLGITDDEFRTMLVENPSALISAQD